LFFDFFQFSILVDDVVRVAVLPVRHGIGLGDDIDLRIVGAAVRQDVDADAVGRARHRIFDGLLRLLL
jgi:hypothetical protein